jgi:hypothetical protein
MGPLQHRAGVVFGEQIQPHEFTQHPAAEGFGEDFDLVVSEVQEGAIGPEGAVGDEQMQMWKAHDGAGLLCPHWERHGNLPNLRVEKHQVYTIEPRLPVEGHGIATVEEIVAVDDDGCTWLSRPQPELYLVRS